MSDRSWQQYVVLENKEDNGVAVQVEKEPQQEDWRQYIKIETPTTPRKEEPSMLEEATLGLKESFLPFQVTGEEARREPTLTRGIANIAGDLAQVLGSARIGAAIGSAVSPGVGTLVGAGLGLATGIYRAWGMESVRARAEKREVDPSKVAVNIVTETLPMIRHTSRLMNAALSLGQVAAQYKQARQYGASGEQAFLLGVVGGGLTAATRSKITPDEIAKNGIAAFATDPSLDSQAVKGLDSILRESDTSLKLKQRVYDRLVKNKDTEDALKTVIEIDTSAPTVKEQLRTWGEVAPEIKKHIVKAARDEVQLDTTSLKRLRTFYKKQGLIKDDDDFKGFIYTRSVRDAFYQSITGEKTFTAKTIEKARKILERETIDLEHAYVAWRLKKNTMAELRKVVKGKELEDPLKNPFLRWLASDMHIGRTIDFVLGTDFRSLFDRIGMAELNHSLTVRRFDSEVRTIAKNIRRARVDSTDIKKMLEMPRATRREYIQKKYGNRADAVESIVAQVRDYFDQARTYAQSYGMVIPYRERYVTSMQQDAVDAVVNMKKTLKEVRRNPRKLRLLWDAARFITGRDIETFSELQEIINNLTPRELMKNRIGYEAAATFARRGIIPELLQEQDIVRIMRAYSRNLSRAVNLDQPIKDLNDAIPILDALKWNTAARHLEEYVQRVSGQPGMAVSWLQNQMAKSKAVLRETVDPDSDATLFRRTQAKAKLMAMDFSAFIMNQVYPNYLGGRLKPVLRNLLQPTLMTGREISGTGYGEKLAAGGYWAAARAKLAGKNLEKEVLDYTEQALSDPAARKYWSTVKFASGARRAFDEGLQLEAIKSGLKAGGVIEKSAQVIDWMGQTSMWMYGKSDMVNRYVTIQMGKRLTRDIIKGHRAARKFVANADPALKADIARILKIARREDREKLLELTINGYLITKTQFLYTKAAGFKLGRELGPLFTMFSKWGVMIGSDVAEGFKRGRGTRNLVQKYLAPLAALGAVYRATDELRDTPRGQVLWMRSAFQLSPLAAPVSVGAPPVLRMGNTAAQVLGHAFAMDLDVKRVEEAAKSIAGGFIPGAWVPRSASEAYILITGEEP